MIWIFFIITLAMIGLGWFITENSCWAEEFGAVLFTAGIVLLVGVIIAIAVIWTNVIILETIDDQIAMYEAENDEIELQIEAAVLAYQKHETDVFKDLKSESYITLISLYPELKSDVLVQKQIDVYVLNNENIKALKMKKITGSALKWWLYFGG